jgi:hypothetical protein
MVVIVGRNSSSGLCGGRTAGEVEKIGMGLVTARGNRNNQGIWKRRRAFTKAKKRFKNDGDDKNAENATTMRASRTGVFGG